MVVVAILCLVLVACLTAPRAARSQAADLTIANFSNAELQLLEVRNGADHLIGTVRSSRGLSHPGAAGTAWRIRWLLGDEVCRFVMRDRRTVVTVDAPAMPAGWRQQTVAGFRVLFSPALLRDPASFD